MLAARVCKVCIRSNSCMATNTSVSKNSKNDFLWKASSVQCRMMIWKNYRACTTTSLQHCTHWYSSSFHKVVWEFDRQFTPKVTDISFVSIDCILYAWVRNTWACLLTKRMDLQMDVIFNNRNQAWQESKYDRMHQGGKLFKIKREARKVKSKEWAKKPKKNSWTTTAFWYFH